MNEKDTVIRQRLIELERKHAKALRKLQRAERSKQRRQTFHGFAVKDDRTDHSGDSQYRSSTPLSEKVFTPGVRRTSPLSHHKKRLCKSVTFKDTVETNRHLHSEKSSKENEDSSRFKEKNIRKSAPTVGKIEPEADVKALQGHTDSNCHSFIAVDKDCVKSFSDLPPLSEKEKTADICADGAELKDCSRTEDVQDCTVNKAKIVGYCGIDTDISITTKCQELSNSAKEVIVGEEKKNPILDTAIVEDIHFLGHESEDILSKEGKTSVKVKDSFVQEHDNISPQNWHWLHLFEEEFPRRSPRLQSTPNLGSETVVSQDNSQVRKTKRARSKHSRTKKETPSCSKGIVTKYNVSDTATHSDLAEEIQTEGFVFPKPSSEQTKNGGFLSAIVDFSLPDNEFAKLKLAKIKGALPVEKIHRVVNDKSEKVIEEHGILVESKSEEEMKEGCSHPLTRASNSVLLCSMQVEANPAENTSEGNRTNTLPVLSMPVDLECKNESKCSVNNFLLSSKHQLHEILVEKEPVNICKDIFSPKLQPLEDKTRKTEFLSQADVESGHHDSSHVETCCVTAVADDVKQTISTEKQLSTSDYEDHNSCNDQDKLDYKTTSDNNERLLITTVQCYSRRPQEMNGFSNERDSNFYFAKTDGIHKPCGTEFPLEVGTQIQKTPEKLYDQRELFNLTEKRSSPLNHELRIGDQATPYGKMKQPQETSQLPCMTSPEDKSELSPVLMMACLQHHIEGENNKVRSIALSSYEPLAEKDVTLLKKKRDVLAVCLAHLVVVWTVVPGLQWTVLHKWSLPTDGGEEFVSVQIVPLKSHVALLVGGNFNGGNGRILGYSELEGDYSFDLQQDDKRNTHDFSTMCLLSGNGSVECAVASKTFHEVKLTKWTLDGFCLLVEQEQCFAPIITESDLSSLHTVQGSHCLLVGTTDDRLFLWNHRTCQLLQSISLHTMDFRHLSCLKAFTAKGFLFLMIASKSGKEIVWGEDANTGACLLFALNPNTSKMICLERFSLEQRLNTLGTNGQYIAAAHQAGGKVNIWNITNHQRHLTLQVFQDEVSSVEFHRDRPVVAFGSTGGCVHLFSLC